MEILKNMIKEEWRIHSRMFGSFMFGFFPVLILIFAMAGSWMLPTFKEMLPDFNFSYLFQLLFIFFGLSVGSFGMMAKEFMNRRFGQASLVAYSSRTLPLSEKTIFANFVVKDVIFYLLLWILPFTIGYGIVSVVFGGSLEAALLVLETATLCFMIGLSISFFLSTIYANSKKLLLATLGILIGAFAIYGFAIESLLLLPAMTMEKALAYLISSIALSSLSIIFVKIDYHESKKQFGNAFSKLCKSLKFDYFVAKDLLDINRSEGGLGKIIFSFLMPLAIVWLAMNVMMKIIPQSNYTLIFAVFLGAISSTIYNWLTEFDIFTSYAFLPVRVSDVIKSKLRSYLMINILSVIIMAAVAFQMNSLASLPLSLVVMASISLYTLSTIIFLSGLYPNIMLYNAKIFTQYVLMNSPLLLAVIFLSILFPAALYLTPLLLVLAWKLLQLGFEKWDSWEHPNF